MTAFVCECGIAPLNLLFFWSIDWSYAKPHDLALLSIAFEQFLGMYDFHSCGNCKKPLRPEKGWVKQLEQLHQAVEDINPETGVTIFLDPSEILSEWHDFLLDALPLRTLLNLLKIQLR